MKEATGELNLTVITVVAIAAIGALFYSVIWPIISKRIRLANACSIAADTVFPRTGKDGGIEIDKESKIYCHYTDIDDQGRQRDTVVCYFPPEGNSKGEKGSMDCNQSSKSVNYMQ